MKQRIENEEVDLNQQSKLKILRSSIEDKLVHIDNLIHKNQGDIQRNTIDKVSAFQRRARSALAKAQDANKLKQLLGQISKLQTDLEQQLP